MENMQSAIAVDPGLVRAKAYELWQSLGCPDGAAERTWLEAERQLLAARADLVRESSAQANIAATPAELGSSPSSSRPASDSVVPPSSRNNSKPKKRSARR